MKRRLAIGFGVLLFLLAAVYVWGFAIPMTPDGEWSFDLAEVRRLATSMEGERPSEVRAEPIAVFEFPSEVQVSGTGWAKRDMTCFAYQLVFPGRTALL